MRVSSAWCRVHPSFLWYRVRLLCLVQSGTSSSCCCKMQSGGFLCLVQSTPRAFWHRVRLLCLVQSGTSSSYCCVSRVGVFLCLVQMKPRAFCSRGRLLCLVQSWASALTAAWSRVVPSPLSGLVHTDLQVEYTGVLTLTVLEDLQKLCRLHCSSPIDGFYRKSTQGCTYPNRLADLQKEYIEYFPHRIKDLQEKCTRAMHFPSPVLATLVFFD